MEVRDSRRVPGLNVIWDHAGAVLDVFLEPAQAESFLAAWEHALREALAALEWEASFAVRRIPGGLSLALAAPLDSLFAATEVNEWACACARAAVLGCEAEALTKVLPRFRREIAREKRRRKGLLRLEQSAAEHGVSLFSDDDCTSIGMGTGSLSFPTAELPLVQSIDWARLHDIPVALVTGTNGKSTSVRLLAAMAEAAGLVAGISTTDWVRVGERILQHGDYSGSSGARMVLRDQRVEIGVLECARGGLSRRGLAVRKARAALITNVAEDHLGEWGVHDLHALADVKFIVARALEPGGVLVLNADDPELLRRGLLHSSSRVVWFTCGGDHALVREHLRRGGEAAIRDGEALWYARGERRERILEIGEASFLFGGAAGHNISNALGAIGVAFALGLGFVAIRAGLMRFSSDPEHNPGRLNQFEFGGVRALCDFAHNPHGMVALLSMLAALPGKRRLVILGQAGDRDDHSIRELARLTAEAKPDRIVIKEMPEHMRGREPGVVVRMIADELGARGYPKEDIEFAADESEAVRKALNWSRPGDILLLLLHAQRGAVLEWLERVRRASWIPGTPLPN